MPRRRRALRPMLPGECFKKLWCSYDANRFHPGQRVEASLVLVCRFDPVDAGWGQRRLSYLLKIELKSLILAQIERWRHALHMQVERARGQLLVSGERVSNASERVRKWGITPRKRR